MSNRNLANYSATKLLSPRVIFTAWKHLTDCDLSSWRVRTEVKFYRGCPPKKTVCFNKWPENPFAFKWEKTYRDNGLHQSWTKKQIIWKNAQSQHATEIMDGWMEGQFVRKLFECQYQIISIWRVGNSYKFQCFLKWPFLVISNSVC